MKKSQFNEGASEVSRKYFADASIETVARSLTAPIEDQSWRLQQQAGRRAGRHAHRPSCDRCYNKRSSSASPASDRAWGKVGVKSETCFRLVLTGFTALSPLHGGTVELFEDNQPHLIHKSSISEGGGIVVGAHLRCASSAAAALNVEKHRQEALPRPPPSPTDQPALTVVSTGSLCRRA